jgi:hypothetical protein
LKVGDGFLKEVDPLRTKSEHLRAPPPYLFYTENPYMHAIIETSVFLQDVARAGISDDERANIIDLIARNPMDGDLIPGTGGARKLRVAGRGKGKSGGFRVVTYYAAKDVPILMLAMVDKSERADLSQAEKNALRERLSRFAPAYRDGVKERLRNLRGTE